MMSMDKSQPSKKTALEMYLRACNAKSMPPDEKVVLYKNIVTAMSEELNTRNTSELLSYFATCWQSQYSERAWEKQGDVHLKVVDFKIDENVLNSTPGGFKLSKLTFDAMLILCGVVYFLHWGRFENKAFKDMVSEFVSPIGNHAITTDKRLLSADNLFNGLAFDNKLLFKPKNIHAWFSDLVKEIDSRLWDLRNVIAQRHDKKDKNIMGSPQSGERISEPAAINAIRKLTVTEKAVAPQKQVTAMMVETNVEPADVKDMHKEKLENLEILHKQAQIKRVEAETAKLEAEREVALAEAKRIQNQVIAAIQDKADNAINRIQENEDIVTKGNANVAINHIRNEAVAAIQDNVATAIDCIKGKTDTAEAERTHTESSSCRYSEQGRHCYQPHAGQSGCH